MKQPKFLPSWIIIVCTLPLLGILAFNQFNWLQELQRKERERIESNMANSVSALSDKIQYEIRLLPNLINISQENPIGEVAFDQQIRFWKMYAKTPSILKRVILFQDQRKGGLEWTGGTIVPVSDKTMDQVIREQGSETDDEALILFPVHLPNTPKGMLVCAFDKKEIRDALIPDLAEETLKNANLYGYRIVDEKNREVLYRSEANYPDSAFASPDVVMALGRTKIEAISFQKAYDIQQALTPPPFGGPLPRERDFSRAEDGRTMDKIGAGIDSMANLFPNLSVEIINKDGSLRDIARRSTIQNAILSFSIVVLLLIGMLVLAEATRRAHELALRQNEFVATVTHELKTPLAIITSAAQNLADGFVREQEKTVQYGMMIRKEASRLGVSIEHFLLYSRTGNNWRMKPEACDIQELVESALKFTEEDRLTNGFTTEVVMPDAPILVTGDRIALESVLRNLVQNVTRHAREGKYLGIIVTETESRKRKDSWNVVIKVRDKGHGISPKEQKTIFEPFVRGAYAVNNQIPGNGIGLNLVKRIVTVHGGTVSVDSKSGIGSTFIVTLPENGGELHGNQNSDD